MAKTDLTAQRLRELLNYDPETGVFTWLRGGKGKAIAGQEAGYISHDSGYRLIGVLGNEYRAHRLAWLHVHGEWPRLLLDHVNGIRADNRLCNLREADPSDNCENRSQATKSNALGILGVCIDSYTGRYLATIQVRGKRLNLGRFDTAEQASAAYLAAKRKLHRFCVI